MIQWIRPVEYLDPLQTQMPRYIDPFPHFSIIHSHNSVLGKPLGPNLTIQTGFPTVSQIACINKWTHLPSEASFPQRS